jgi:hypothetical protein
MPEVAAFAPEEGDPLPHPKNGKADYAQPTSQTSVSSSKHPAKKAGFDRTQLANPEVQRPVGERQDTKQTTVKIRKNGGKFYRIHPDPMTQAHGISLLINKSGNAKILGREVTVETRAMLRSMKVLKDADLYLACDEEGSYFVIYFSASDHENAESWVDSGRIVAQTATREWINHEANMHEGGYRIDFAKGKYPQLAASKPKWELQGEDDPVQMFEQVIEQNLILNDNSATIQKMLASRK